MGACLTAHCPGTDTDLHQYVSHGTCLTAHCPGTDTDLHQYVSHGTCLTAHCHRFTSIPDINSFASIMILDGRIPSQQQN